MVVAVGVLIVSATNARCALGVVRMWGRLALLFGDAGVDRAVEIVFL